MGAAERIKETLAIGDKAFYKRMMAISLPIMLQQVVSTAMYMVDTMMVGALGENQLAGLGAANQVTYLVDITLFGLMSGGSVFIAQYYGKKDVKGIQSSLGFCLMTAILVCVLSLCAVQLWPAQLVGVFNPDPAVIEYGRQYIVIASFGYLCKGIIYSYGTANKATGHAMLPMLSGLCGLAVNIFFNYCMIFGNLGFPAMGVEGAAYATIIGCVADIAMLISMNYVKRTVAAARLKAMLAQTVEGVRQKLVISVPVLVNDMLWALGSSLYMAFYGRMGTDTFAAMTIFGTIDKLVFIAVLGMGTACSVMLGNSIGAGEQDQARRNCSRFLAIGTLAAVALGVLVSLVGSRIPWLYNVSEQVRVLAGDTITVYGALMWLSMYNFIIIVGTLRAGGDTKAGAMIDVLPMWLWSVPSLFVFGVLMKLPLPTVFFIMIFPAELARLIFATLRMRKGRWMRDLT